MTWWIQPSEIAGANGEHTGRWRMTATSDEGGGGPFGDSSHDHASAKEAEECDACDAYVSGCSGFPSRKRQAEMNLERERREYERLKDKFDPRSPQVSATEDQS